MEPSPVSYHDAVNSLKAEHDIHAERTGNALAQMLGMRSWTTSSVRLSWLPSLLPPAFSRRVRIGPVLMHGPC